MRVTVAIPTYNRAPLLRQTLAGIALQGFPAEEFEVLVIDNKSGDDTAAVVESFAGTKPAPRRILETRQGLDHARNRAIAEARGDLVLFGDDDILAPPEWIARMSAPFARPGAERIGAVGGEVVPVFPDGLPRWLEGAHRPLAFRSDAGPLGPAQTPMGANLAFPRRVFAEHGVFHTDLDRRGARLFGGGDGEMIRRLREAGLEIWFQPAAAVRHQIPASRLTFAHAARHAFDSARSRVADRAGGPGAKAYLASRLAAHAAKAPACLLLAAACLLSARTGGAKKALVRAWRSCGYIYQVPRSLAGKL